MGYGMFPASTATRASSKRCTRRPPPPTIPWRNVRLRRLQRELVRYERLQQEPRLRRRRIFPGDVQRQRGRRHLEVVLRSFDPGPFLLWRNIWLRSLSRSDDKTNG